MRWSETVVDYYPVNPRSRYGHGLPTHALIAQRLAERRSVFEGVLAEIEASRDILHAIPHQADPGDPARPHWHNVWFTALDAAALVGFIAARRPKRYLEIGSGFSTRFASYAKRAAGLQTTITSIDPRPRAEIDALCDLVIRKPLEECDQSVFDELEAGDILFYDGSHRVFTNSDVTVFFLEILPRLNPGVLVHIHDIFLPDDYPPGWSKRLYSEQYMLAPLLMATQDMFEVTLPSYFVSRDEALGARVRALFEAADGGRPIPFVYPNGTNCPGASFWLTIGEGGRSRQAFTLPPLPPAAPGPMETPSQAIEFTARRMRDFRPRTILDVGAHRGRAARQLRAAYKDAALYCFEPVPSSFALLREAMGTAPNTEILPIALGRRAATVRMQAREAHPMNRLLRPGEAVNNSVEVEVTTGDAFCAARGIASIDILKIETEGGDLDVLLGFSGMLAERAIRVVQVQAGMSPDNDRHVPLSRYMSLLGDHGYLLLHLFDEVRRNPRLPPDRQQLHGMWCCTAVFIAERPESLVLGPAGMNR